LLLLKPIPGLTRQAAYRMPRTATPRRKEKEPRSERQPKSCPGASQLLKNAVRGLTPTRVVVAPAAVLGGWLLLAAEEGEEQAAASVPLKVVREGAIALDQQVVFAQVLGRVADDMLGVGPSTGSSAVMSPGAAVQVRGPSWFAS